MGLLTTRQLRASGATTLMVALVVTAGIASACFKEDDVIGTYGGPLTGPDDDRTCPVEDCESSHFVSASIATYPDGAIDPTASQSGSWPSDPCRYYLDPVYADGGPAAGEWASADTLGNGEAVGYDFEATYQANPTPVVGHVANKTCAPSPLRGEGSYPPDGCGWKYQCIPDVPVDGGGP